MCKLSPHGSSRLAGAQDSCTPQEEGAKLEGAVAKRKLLPSESSSSQGGGYGSKWQPLDWLQEEVVDLEEAVA